MGPAKHVSPFPQPDKNRKFLLFLHHQYNNNNNIQLKIFSVNSEESFADYKLKYLVDVIRIPKAHTSGEYSYLLI